MEPEFSFPCSQQLGNENSRSIKRKKFLSHLKNYPCSQQLDEVTCEWRRLHNEELNDLFSSPHIVRVIKSRRMRWAGHVTRMCEERGCIGSWWGNRRKRDHWGDLGVDGWIILGRISGRWDVGCGHVEWIGLAQDRERWLTLVSAVMNLRVP